jgi:hypothetical protein
MATQALVGLQRDVSPVAKDDRSGGILRPLESKIRREANLDVLSYDLFVRFLGPSWRGSSESGSRDDHDERPRTDTLDQTHQVLQRACRPRTFGALVADTATVVPTRGRLYRGILWGTVGAGDETSGLRVTRNVDDLAHL